jgi:glycosyltransferase involved in cell wall biosynthesis
MDNPKLSYAIMVGFKSYKMDYNRGIKILFVVNWLKRRGAEQQLFYFIKELPPHVDVSIFRFSNAADEFPELFKLDKVNIHSNRYPGTYNFLRFKSLYECLSQKRYDVVITTGLGAALFFGRICAFLSGIKIVYSLLNTFENFHNLPTLPGDYFDILNKGLNTLILRLRGGKIYRFLPNSEKLAAKIRLAVNGYPVHTLHNGLPTKEFEKLSTNLSDEQTRSIHNQFEGSPTITQVGALDGTKNQLFTLECIKEIKEHIPNVRYLVIGEGGKKPELVRWVSSNGLEKHVIFAGQLNRMDCLYLMNKSNLLVLTSESESFPNVLVEAQALSLPVVTFDVGAASEIIDHGVTGYVIQKGDQAGFKKYSIELLTDKDRATRMGKTGQERVLGLFGMERKIEKFLSILEKDSLLNSRL